MMLGVSMCHLRRALEDQETANQNFASAQARARGKRFEECRTLITIGNNITFSKRFRELVRGAASLSASAL